MTTSLNLELFRKENQINMATSGAEISVKDYIFTEKLGSGTYATVYKAYKKVSLEHYIIIHLSILQIKSNARYSEHFKQIWPIIAQAVSWLTG